MSEFVVYLVELFQDFGSVTARRMFGGHGIFHDGLMIGLVSDDTLYLRTDAQTVAQFQEQGCSQFNYLKGKKMVGLPYYLAPGEALDDPAVMREWAQLALGAARRARK